MLSKEVSEQSLGLKANLMVSISEQHFSIRKRTFDANSFPAQVNVYYKQTDLQKPANQNL